MNKLFTKIASLSVGLALVVGVGVAVGGSKSVAKVSAEDSAFMTFDFEDSTAHRTSGNNNYASENSYEENGSAITMLYADSVTSGTPLSGSANIMARVAKNTTNSPWIIFGPMDLSSYFVSGFSYYAKSPAAFTFTASYSTDGETWTVGETHTDKTSAETFTSSEISVNESNSFYLKIEISVGSSTGSNRDAQIDNVKIIGHSTSTKALESISCSAQSVDVIESMDLASKVVYAPSDAANKNVSFSVKSGSEFIDMTSAGVITGKKGGSAVVTITPEDTSAGATAIDVTITVNSITAPALTVGDQYVIYAVDSKNSYSGELTGVASSVGTVEQMTGEIPSCKLPFSTVAGYYENTVSFYDGSKYLSLNSAGNNLNLIADITANSSWIVTVADDVLSIINAAFTGREIRFNYNSGNPRFACYALGGQTAISLYHYEEKALNDFTIESEINVYVSESKAIEVTYDPADAADKVLNWSSASDSVATVDQDGVVTGVAVGEAIITASKTIQGVLVERTCTVHVLNNVASHHGTAADPFDVADAVQVAKGVFTKDPDGNPINLSNSYYVEGLITNCVNRTTSTLTFWIGDNASQISATTGGFEVFKVKSVYGVELGTAYTDNKEVTRDFNVGNRVLVYSTFTFYQGTTPETNQNVADIKYSNYIEARKYAESFNSAFEAEGVCDAEGQSDLAVLSTVWGQQGSAFDELDEYAQAVLTEAEASTASSASAVELCAAKYDYIGGKYQTQLGLEFDFMGRNPSPIASGARFANNSNEVNDNVMIMIIVIAAASAIMLSTLLIIKKKKHN